MKAITGAKIRSRLHSDRNSRFGKRAKLCDILAHGHLVGSFMTTDKQPQRALIYSHDSFGLGHLRRCRAIAHALVDQNPSMSVIILSLIHI